jgi:hypothetical protein
MIGFLSVNGTVPWIKIVIWILVGIVIGVLYCKYKKPSFIFEEMSLEGCLANLSMDKPIALKKLKRQDARQETRPEPINEERIQEIASTPINLQDED